MPAADRRRRRPVWPAARTCWTPAPRGPRPRSPGRAHSRGARPPRHGRGRRAPVAPGSGRPKVCPRSAAAPRASRAWPEPPWVSQPAGVPRHCPREREPAPRLCLLVLNAEQPEPPGGPSRGPEVGAAAGTPWPSGAAGMSVSPPAGPGAMTGVAPALGASACRGPTRHPPLALTHRGPGRAGLPASREGPRAGGAWGSPAAASSRLQRGRASCARRGWGAQQAHAWAQPGAGLLGP